MISTAPSRTATRAAKRTQSGMVSLTAAFTMVATLAVGVAAGWTLNDRLTQSPAAAPPPVALTEEAPFAATPTAQEQTDVAPPAEETPTAAPEPVVHRLRGTLQLTVNRNPGFPENCRGFDEEGYGDIHIGQQIVVADATGRTVATGKLEKCAFSPMEGAEQARGLKFTFVVPGVPETDFVTVQVGTGQRGQVTYSRQDLDASGWKINLDL